MRDRIATAIGVVLLSLTTSACGDRPDAGGAGKEEAMDQLLSTAQRARLDACLAQAITPPWQLVRSQPFVKNLSVTIEARTDDLQLPHRPLEMRRQQFVELGIGRGSNFPMPSSAELQSQISQGLLVPRAEIAGVPAAEFEPFVPYTHADWIWFLNIPGDEQCRYSTIDIDRPNPFVECKARRGEYTVSLTFPHDAIVQLPRVFAAARPIIQQVTSCFDLTKEM